MSKQLSRRALLHQSLLLGVGLSVPAFSASSPSSSIPLMSKPKDIWLSATGKTKQDYGLGWYQSQSQSQSQSLPANFRGHACAVHPTRASKVVLVGRRPGTECLQVDLAHGHQQRWMCESGYHLNGHACFSQDGKKLFVCESTNKEEQGSIAVRNADTGEQLARWKTAGLEPHELVLSPNGRMLIVANGGLQKGHDGQVKNRSSMRSCISFLDSQTGELIQQIDSPRPNASLRHMAIDKQGNLVIAAQIQEDPVQETQKANSATQPSDLAYVLPPGGASLQALSAPDTLLSHCKNYMGSVAISSQTGLACFTSPRGDLALFWNIHSGALAGYHRFHDVCGVTLDQSENYFVLSNSSGWLRYIDQSGLNEVRSWREKTPLNWDNHMTSIRPMRGV